MAAPDIESVEPPPRYWDRRRSIAACAAGIDHPPTDIAYGATENEVWAVVSAELAPLWEQHAAAEVLAARDRLGLPTDRVPQLREVSATLAELTGFEYRAVPGLVPVAEFFGGLADGLFSSTQYLRWEGSPLYTPEPDMIHEVMGHANCLACPEIAELHRLAGRAMGRAETERVRQFVADVFWFTAEFGVVHEGDEVRAYGTGLLSSPGELAWFADHADIRPIDVEEMGTTEYDIDVYQPVLFAADSLPQMLDIVGPFFDEVTDESIQRILEESG